MSAVRWERAVRWAPAAAAGLLLVVGLAIPEPAGWELAVLDAMAPGPGLVGFMETMSDLGSSPVLAVLVLAVTLAARRSAYRWAPAVAYVGAVASYTILKAIVGRDRPLDGAAVFGDAFPSGHATQATAVLLVCAFVIAGRRRSWLVVLAGIVAGLVGASRVVLGVHWPADVLAGWVLGASWFVSLTDPRGGGRSRLGRGGGGEEEGARPGEKSGNSDEPVRDDAEDEGGGDRRRRRKAEEGEGADESRLGGARTPGKAGNAGGDLGHPEGGEDVEGARPHPEGGEDEAERRRLPEDAGGG